MPRQTAPALTLVIAIALAACSGSPGSAAPGSAAPDSAAPSTASEAPSVAASTAPSAASSETPSPAVSAAPSEGASGGASAGTEAACTVSTELTSVPVSIKDFMFNPDPVTAQVGDVIGWTNDDTAAHTATLDDGTCTTGEILVGASAMLTFAAAGMYPYHCEIHPFMMGNIEVSE
jgi:plastocyanin